MATRTVAQVAAEAQLDSDEALVALWDAGIDSVTRPQDGIPPGRLEDARKALGLASKSELTSLKYWTNRLDLSDAELRAVLSRAGMRCTSGARNVPKGGVRVLRKYERSADGGVQPTHLAAEESAARQSATTPKLSWHNVGRERPLTYLSEDEVFAIHEQLFADYLTTIDPIDTPGVSSQNLLSSACSRPRTSRGSVRKYPTAEMAAAALAHSLVHNHSFWNGNKRTALVAYLVFLEANGLMVTCNDHSLFQFILRVAQHRMVPRDWSELPDREVLKMAEWTRDNSRAILRGERPMRWHRFRRILAENGCRCEQAKGVGNRMNIYREVEVAGLFGLGRRRKRLRVQVAYGDEGRQVDRGTLKFVRAQLEFDEEHGVDSGAFYEGEPITAGQFILRYKGILKRLAQL